MKILPINNYYENNKTAFKARLSTKTYSAVLSEIPATKEGNEYLSNIIKRVAQVGLASTIIDLGKSYTDGETSRTSQTTSYGDFVTLSTSASRKYNMSNPLFGDKSVDKVITIFNSKDYIDGEEEIPNEISGAYVGINESINDAVTSIKMLELELYKKYLEDNQKGTALEHLNSILPELKEQGATTEFLQKMLKIADKTDRNTYGTQRQFINIHESMLDDYNKQIQDSILK